MPNLMLLQWYREMGGEILTVGSDAHAPASLAFGLEQGYALARRGGFRYFTTFHQRQPYFTCFNSHDLLHQPFDQQIIDCLWLFSVDRKGLIRHSRMEKSCKAGKDISLQNCSAKPDHETEEIEK